MASLENQKPKNTYTGLLKTTDDAAVGATKKPIVDGGQNATGLGLSTNKVFANTLRVENAPTSSTNTNVATLNASGDVESRSIASAAFNSTLSQILLAKCNANDVTPIQYELVGSTSADSVAVGTDITVNTADDGQIIVTGNVGDIVEVLANLNFNFEQTDASVRVAIVQNGVSMQTSDFKNIAQTSATDVAFQMMQSVVLKTTADVITITRTPISGATTPNATTFVKVQKYA